MGMEPIDVILDWKLDYLRGTALMDVYEGTPDKLRHAISYLERAVAEAEGPAEEGPKEAVPSFAGTDRTNGVTISGSDTARINNVVEFNSVAVERVDPSGRITLDSRFGCR